MIIQSIKQLGFKPEDIKPDIFLAAHMEWFNFEDKRKRVVTEGAKYGLDVSTIRSIPMATLLLSSLRKQP
jgi:hypothetical protein